MRNQKMPTFAEKLASFALTAEWDLLTRTSLRPEPRARPINSGEVGVRFATALHTTWRAAERTGHGPGRSTNRPCDDGRQQAGFPLSALPGIKRQNAKDHRGQPARSEPAHHPTVSRRKCKPTRLAATGSIRITVKLRIAYPMIRQSMDVSAAGTMKIAPKLSTQTTTAACRWFPV